MFSHVFLALFAIVNPTTDNSNPNERLLGTWTVITAEKDGQAQDAWVGGSATFTAEAYTVTVGGEAIEQGTFQATLADMNIELKPDTGEATGQTELGIVSADDRYLVLCKARPGNTRPALFDSTVDNQQTLFVLKRVADQFGNQPESFGNEND